MEFKQLLTFQSTSLLDYLKFESPTYQCSRFITDNSR